MPFLFIAYAMKETERRKIWSLLAMLIRRIVLSFCRIVHLVTLQYHATSFNRNASCLLARNKSSICCLVWFLTYNEDFFFQIPQLGGSTVLQCCHADNFFNLLELLTIVLYFLPSLKTTLLIRRGGRMLARSVVRYVCLPRSILARARGPNAPFLCFYSKIAKK